MTIDNQLKPYQQIERSAEEIFKRAYDAGRLKVSDQSVMNDARQWIREVDNSIAERPSGEALDIVGGLYDMMHRIAYSCQANIEFVDKYVLKAFDALLHGDKTVDEYLLYHNISDAITNRHSRAFMAKPLQWLSISKDCWYRQFRTGHCSEHLSDYDTLQRVSILLQDNLYAFEGRNEAAFKQKLFNNYRHHLDDLNGRTHKELFGLKKFLYASSPFLSLSEFSHYADILS